jgi:hypothetical protein
LQGITEEEAELLFEEHLRERGWNITDLCHSQTSFQPNGKDF